MREAHLKEPPHPGKGRTNVEACWLIEFGRDNRADCPLRTPQREHLGMRAIGGHKRAAALGNKQGSRPLGLDMREGRTRLRIRAERNLERRAAREVVRERTRRPVIHDGYEQLRSHQAPFGKARDKGSEPLATVDAVLERKRR